MDLNQPLAYRMKPKTLDDYVGQEHILGKDKILYRTIKADRLSSIILWGPPGCGKTSLAKVISNTTKYKFTKINAVTAGIGDIKNAIEEAETIAKAMGAKKVVVLKTVGPFHTPKLLEASQVFRNDLEKITFSEFTVPVIKNLDGTVYKKEDSIKEILEKHIISPVRFSKSLETM